MYIYRRQPPISELTHTYTHAYTAPPQGHYHILPSSSTPAEEEREGERAAAARPFSESRVFPRESRAVARP